MSVKATELRIGNYVQDNSGYVIVDAELLMELSTKVAIVEPVYISSEILLKIGFQKDEDYAAEPVSSRYILVISDKIKGSNIQDFTAITFNKTLGDIKKSDVFVNYTVDNAWGSNNFSSLHQLQNLYHALTGEELNIEL